MTAYAWTFPVNRFEMRILPNTRSFTGPYTPTTQTIDLLGERWIVSLDLPPTTDPIVGAAREAYFDRLKASANTITMGHQIRTVPQGTMRSATAAVTWKNNAAVTAVWKNNAAVTANWLAGGAPYTAAAIAQLANTGTLQTLAGNTLRAGDMLGLGGQLVRIMADTVADAGGLMPIEFQPRARAAIAAGVVVIWSQPTANFILKPGTPNVPTSWTPGVISGASLELIEIY